jgi:hypothetical protein
MPQIMHVIDYGPYDPPREHPPTVTTTGTGGYMIPTVFMDKIVAEATRPIPSFYKPTTYVQPRITRRMRLRWRIASLRERIGFAIAGYTPSEDY